LRAQPTSESSFELDTTLPPETGGEIGWKLLGPDGTYTTLAYDPNKRELFVDRVQATTVSVLNSPPAPALRYRPFGDRWI
jgi:glycosyl hydrolase family 32